MNCFYPRASKLALATILAIGSTTANASGFAIIEQSVTGLGNAFAGGAAGAEDVSTIYFNPAGLTQLQGTQYALAAHLIKPSVEFKDGGSRHFTGAPLDVNNEDGGDAGELGVVPNFYYSRDLGNQWTVGIGVGAPFGLKTDYDKGWTGRYHALESDLKTVNVNPSAAYKANDKLSLGFGVNIQYIEATLSNAVDYGGICFAGENIAMTLAPGTCGALGLSPQANDGEAEVEGDDISFGFNLGMMYQVTDSTRIGAAYRSRIEHELEGDADFDTPANASPIAAAQGLVDTDADADIDLPDTLSVGFHHAANSKLAIMGDVTWTNWSLVEEIRIEFENGAADSVVTLDWDDSYRYSLGMTYAYTSSWTLRAGIAYDESATPNERLLTPRVPDEDRTWLAFGATYNNPKNNMQFDVGYAHLFVDDADVNKPLDAENLLRGNLNGEYELDANILSAQARWSF